MIVLGMVELFVVYHCDIMLLGLCASNLSLIVVELTFVSYCMCVMEMVDSVEL